MGKYIDVEYIQRKINRTFDESTTPTRIQLNDFIVIAEDEFDREFGDYSIQSNTEITDGFIDGIYISKFPINSITSVSRDKGTPFEHDWDTALESTNYYIDPEIVGKIVIKNPYVGSLNYQVVYDSGYAFDDVPANIKYLVYLMVMKKTFQYTFLNDNGSSNNVTETIDVDVYKEVTKGGSAFNGMTDIGLLIDAEKSNFKGKLKTYLL